MGFGSSGQAGKNAVSRAVVAIRHVFETALDPSLVGQTALDCGTRRRSVIHLSVQVSICELTQ